MKKYYNIHTHIFNAECAPPGFYGRSKKKIVRKITLFPKAKDFLVDLLESLDPLNSHDKGNKLARLLKIGTEESQEEVLLNLFDAYRDFPSMNFVVLSLDMDFMGAGTPIVNYPTQLLELRRIKGRYGDRVSPFVCVDPRRYRGKELVDFVNDYITKYGFSGIKMYPALGFYPFDPALYELYEYAQKFQIPIMTHCDRGGVNYQGKITEEHLNPPCFYTSPGKKGIQINRHSISAKARKQLRFISNDVFCDRFTDPSNYQKVLDVFPDLKICFAHLGGADEILKKSTKTTSWYETIKSLISDARYANIYTDISYTLWNKKAIGVVLKDLKIDSNFQSKVLFGTDFFVVNKRKTEEELVSDFRKGLDAQLFDTLASDNNTAYLEIKPSVYKNNLLTPVKTQVEEETDGTYELEGKVKLKKNK